MSMPENDDVRWQKARERLQRAALEQRHQLPPERVRALLEERARRAARVPAPAPAAETVIEVVLFDLGGERYALESSRVREILRMRDITPLLGVPEFVVGIANLRGQLLTVLDLGAVLGIKTQATSDNARIVVLGDGRTGFGFRADAVHEVRTLPRSILCEPPESLPPGVRAFLRGVTADSLIVLDADVLLSDPRLFVDLSDG